MKIAKRGNVPPFIVMEMLTAANRRAAEGGDVLHLELGEPSTSAPSRVIEEAKRVLEAGPLGYTESTGLPALRARIARYYRETDGFEVAPERIVITTGSNGTYTAVFTAGTAGTATTIHATIGGAAVTSTLPTITVTTTVAGECASPQTGWIWCDDFESDRLSSYFEYDNAGGDFVRAASVGRNGSYGMRARWSTTGQVGAGSLHLAFGKTPDPTTFRPVDAGTLVYRDIYWRMYVRTQPGWTGGSAVKLSRAIAFANANWAEAMIAHVWGDDASASPYLDLDPVRGTDVSGNLLTTTYNDFNNFTWLGLVHGSRPLFANNQAGNWFCVEAHAKLNDAGQSNGVFETWINDTLDARASGLNFLGSYSAFGINAVFFENYWNAGAAQPEERYFDNLVVSTQRIGC